MTYDYSKLIGRIIEKCGARYVFAENLGVSNKTLSGKLSNKIPFKQTEITRAATILDIPEKEIAQYFFTVNVH